MSPATAPPGRRWFVPLVASLTVIVAILACVVVWLAIDDRQQSETLRGVVHAGPCRAIGIEDPECQKQARKIFAACYAQRRECREKYGLVLVRIRSDRSPGEVVHLNPSRAGQLPEPGRRPGGKKEAQPQNGEEPRPGKPGEGGQAPPSQPTPVSPPDSSAAPPSSSPPADPPKGPVGSVADDVGNAVGQVGGRVEDTTCALALSCR